MRRAGLLVLAAFLVLDSALSGEPAKERPQAPRAKKLRVVVIGAHPDDPESGCGGLIALLTRDGHEIVVGYLTCFRGGREAMVRRREAAAAYDALGRSQFSSGS